MGRKEAEAVDVELLNDSSLGGGAPSSALRPRLKMPGGSLGILLWMISIAWVFETIDLLPFFQQFFDQNLGIHPRHWKGLLGLLCSPFLHTDFAHLIGNTIPWLVLGALTILGEKGRFLKCTLILILLSGTGTWLIGRGDSVHIGASGLVYGYLGYLVGRAWYTRRRLWIVTGLVAISMVVIFYGGMLEGLLPLKKGVSWEGHLSGLIAGVWLASRAKLDSLE